MTGDSGYPKTARLRRRREFLAVQHNGRRRHTPHFVIIRTARTGPSRLGVTVSARVGNAVARNRVKRLVREIFRSRRHELQSSADIVVIAKTGADDLTYAQAATELEPVLELVPSR